MNGPVASHGLASLIIAMGIVAHVAPAHAPVRGTGGRDVSICMLTPEARHADQIGQELERTRRLSMDLVRRGLLVCAISGSAPARLIVDPPAGA